MRESPEEAEAARARVRRHLLDIFGSALRAVDGEHRVAAALAGESRESWHIIAIGKAALAMSTGAGVALGARVRQALVIVPQGSGGDHSRLPPQTRVLEAGHPVPDAASLAAGKALVATLGRLPEDARVLFLISGGASALVERLPPAISLVQLQKINAWLLASGCPIEEINAVRRACSLIKGGGLLAALGQREALALLMSDVAGDEPADIGSGLLWPPANDRLPTALPDWVRACTRGVSRRRMDLSRIPETRIIATGRDAASAACERARALGYPARLGRRIDGDALGVGHALAERLRAAPPGLEIAYGETTVRLPAAPGVGGRCQMLALAAATRWHPGERCVLLAAGTDGRDGPGEDAGAVVDGGTVERGRNSGLDPIGCLQLADAGRFLAASGDLVHTGPTGTNVADLVIGGCEPALEGI